MIRFALFAAIAAATVGGAAEASAAVVPQMDLDTLIRQSSVIGIYSVVAVKPDVKDEATGEPLTTFSLKLDTLVLGDERLDAVNLNLPMGRSPEDPDVFLAWGSAPVMIGDRRYLVFLRDGSWLMTPFTNWWWGVFEVVDWGGKSIWLDQDGSCVAGLTSTGFVFGPRVGPPTIEEYFAMYLNVEIVADEDGLGASLQGESVGCATGEDLLEQLSWYVAALAKHDPEFKDPSERRLFTMPDWLSVHEADASASQGEVKP